MLEPHSETSKYHLLDDYLAHHVSFSMIETNSMVSHLKSISTESVAITTSIAFSSATSMDIPHLLINVSSTTDMLHITYLLTITITPLTGTFYPLINLTFAVELDNLQISHLTEPSISA